MPQTKPGTGGLVVPVLAVAAFLAGTVPILLRSGIEIAGVRYVVAGDDLMISLRYAYQFAHGHGLVWNPGEYVQGFTNLGWTLLLSIPYALRVPLGIGPLVPRLANLLLQAILAAAIAFGAWRRGRPIEAATAAVLIAARLAGVASRTRALAPGVDRLRLGRHGYSAWGRCVRVRPLHGPDGASDGHLRRSPP